ncbi:TonB-dependent receptor [Phenylobacterium sp. LH3H17]|uniref:TonB-dependent receptor n=1 Tax=Phenylobacterium sp. LH3H17 TaxID=2903901 RepID=UPI0020C9AE7D|nr:TonB-dependent receptor [Phenylobacterium sp. LH3H17]UTP38313.1 TonB-dependent receptor [Phenylobacterium sp. LH3H17]
MTRSVYLGAAAVAALLSAGSASAQTVDDKSGVALEEVIVTAQRREERLQETPVSVTAFTAAAIERQGIQDIGDVALRTPGMLYGDFGDLKLSPTSLRGIIGSAGSAGSDPAVGYYVDEVFVGQGAGANLDLYDIARVEVLRGPQGTLFGRNTLGGVINIATERPSASFKASGTLAAGNHDYRRAGASISGPILADRLFAKFSVAREQRDGTTLNTTLGRRVNSVDNWSSRGQLLFDMGERTELLITADYRKVDQETIGYETLSYDDTALLPQLLIASGLPLNTHPYDYRIQGDQQNEERLKSGGAAVNFHTSLAGVRLTNIISYRRHDYFSRADTDRSPLSILYDGDPESVWRWSDELRAEFSTGSVNWISGLYYFRQSSRNLSFVEIGGGLANLLGAPSLAGLQVGSNGKLATRSLAAFASGTWKINDRVDVTAGARYTRDKKSIDYIQTDPIDLLGGDAAITAADSWSEVTPSFNLRYRFTPAVLAYATASKGFKSGGFNDALGDANGISFNPERLWNYEAGLKSELLDRRVTLNAALYRMEWTDIQITADNPATPIFDPVILNAGAAHSQGLELEVQARPAPPWTLGASLAIQEAEYDEGVLPSGQPLRRIPQSPSYTFDLNAEYRLETRYGELTFYGEYIGRGTSYLTPDNQQDGKVKPYGLVDARISWQDPDGRIRLSLWGKNLADEVVKQRLFDLSGLGFVAQKFIALNEPRTFGLELKLSY